MGKYVQWIQYKGKRILFSNYAGLSEAEYLNAIDETQREIQQLPNDSLFLGITDLTNSGMSVATAAKGREVAKVMKEKRLKGPSVVVGATALLMSVARLIQPHLYFAKDLKEAKEWIVAQG